MRNDIVKWALSVSQKHARAFFLFTPVILTGSFVAKRITQVESISQNDAYAVWNNNSITGRLFQSKETGGISLHSRRRNARWEPCSAVCTWGRFIRCRFSGMEMRQRIPSPFLYILYNVPTVENYYPLLLFPLYLSYSPHYHGTVMQTARTFAGFAPNTYRKTRELFPFKNYKIKKTIKIMRFDKAYII